MTIFDLLFLLLALVAIITLIVAVGSAVSGRLSRSLRIMRRLGIGVAIYLAIVLIVAIASPQKIYKIGDPQCFDDWCITVSKATRSEAGVRSQYDIALEIHSRAKRAPQRERGTVVYLADERKRRFDPLPDATNVPLDVTVQPGESVTASRKFDLPVDARRVDLIYTAEGGFPIGWFIIGENHLFKKPVVRLD
jgi:hypothetical protein